MSKRHILVFTVICAVVNEGSTVNICDLLTSVAKAATCLLLQVLTAPRAAMLLRSVSRRLLSSSGNSSTAIPPS